ncbi:MAG: DUF1249 domain-containing protein [Sphingobacteriia bacterium]|nr:DUF1249 domain-containing protein [Sphingobacteriia bacterium]NCC38946.1 DUF1249 domain-containing protein [Gammaproteobacteria bacterium]
MDLCEENFTRLNRLAPDLRSRVGVYASEGCDGLSLYLTIEEQARFTTTLRLTHLFPTPGMAPAPDPDARLRVYHDARQVEMLDLHQTILSFRQGRRLSVLAEKWQASLFLGHWLTYCLQQGHAFGILPLEQAGPWPIERMDADLEQGLYHPALTIRS